MEIILLDSDKKFNQKGKGKSMRDNNNKQVNKKEKIEDTTKYGEFISSFFTWETPENQKQIVKKLENITKKEEK